ncbi:receptor-type tyrosine-protein phosphatase S-like [Ornithodoros turicata]|uniref:receptor-type tyrosine-protein phosphatase S-like n=1 Tax=Ornithodoros turicata TaxID=34597 RepID=UPI0031392BD8
MRVIVRICRANKYGPLCESTCPDCKNGGICHDIVGRCICPPGFKGDLCEEPCGDDKFGQQCEKRCSDTNRDPESKTCSGIMICLPDPYGCTCGTGFKGFFCNETCSKHEYGADCKQKRVCHCKNNGACNVFTGTCVDDDGQCLDGWKNKSYCDISYPLLKNKPKVLNITDTSARVTWDAWQFGRDTGEGNPKEYLLQHKETTDESWPTIRHIISPTFYARVLSGLKPDTSYEVRVLVRDSDHKHRSEGAQEERFKTRCGRPSQTPSSIQIDDSSSRSIIVKWKIPPEDSWKCRTVNITLMYNNSSAAFNTTHPAGSAPRTNYSFSTEPYTSWSIRLRLETPDGEPGDWTPIQDVTSAPEAPPAPTGLVATTLSGKNISLTWVAPYPPYGVLDYYNIVFRRRNSTASRTKQVYPNQTLCHGTADTKKQCFTLDGLEPDTKYYIKVLAANKGTVLGRPSEEREAETKILPPGAPRGLSATRRNEDSIRVVWKEPVEKNGVLSNYRLNTSLVHSYDAELLEASRPNSAVLPTSVLRYDLKPLFPGCTYNVCVEASTRAGFGPPDCKQITTRASVPVVEAEPRLERITKNTVRLTLSPVSFKHGPISNYYVLVVRGYDDYQGNVTPVSYQEARDQDLPYYMAARMNPEELKEDRVFVAGDDSVVGGYHNVPLEPTTPYRFAVLVESNFSGDVAYAYRLTQPVVVGHLAIPGIVLSALAMFLLILIFVAAILYYRKRRRATPSRSNKLMVHELKQTLSGPSKLGDGNVSGSRMALNVEDVDLNAVEPIQNNGGTSVPVAVKDFKLHVQRCRENGKLEEEYMSVGRGQLYPWEIAKKPGNISKNRYGNILPYDHSRVVLSRISGPDSDYINANYVPGYNNPRRYIATQGPKSMTTIDFWRMVWEEKSCKIVMLTNLKEKEKVKCEQYWPESTQKYGLVTVRTDKTETSVDFVVREFTVTNEKEKNTRQVVQFHFTTWPDHGVPVYPDAMQPFMKRVREIRQTDTHPIIVHCSGGIGRTGTFILLDSMMDQSEKEGQVNLVEQLRAMRQNRINLVESLDQYMFAHHALVEILCSKSHKMTVQEFTERFHMLRVRSPDSGKSTVEEEIEELNSTNLPSNVTYKAATSPQNTTKNRAQNILAVDARRPYLSVPPDSGRTDYINAVYVDGFKRRNAFLVTQFPLPDTIGDFWQMVATSNARAIVTLDKLDLADERCPQFWPDLNTTAKYYGSKVQNEGTNIESGIVVRTFRVEQTGLKKTQRIVRQFHLQEWPLSNVTPPSCDIMLDLIQKVERWQRQSKNTTLIVQCINGCTNSGLYCASSIVCEQLKTEQELDAFRSVQTIRSSRQQFVRDQSQYEFLYDVALAFLDGFDAYSNFQ